MSNEALDLVLPVRSAPKTEHMQNHGHMQCFGQSCQLEILSIQLVCGVYIIECSGLERNLNFVWPLYTACQTVTVEVMVTDDCYTASQAGVTNTLSFDCRVLVSGQKTSVGVLGLQDPSWDSRVPQTRSRHCTAAAQCVSHSHVIYVCHTNVTF